MEMEKQSSFDKIKIGDNINGEITKKKYFYDKLHNFFMIMQNVFGDMDRYLIIVCWL